jgi:hypothetical protein
VRSVGKTVQAESNWTGSAGEQFEVDAICTDPFTFDARSFGHGETLVE